MNDVTISALISQDRVFGGIMDLYGSPVFHSRAEGFESMCRIILEQQVSLASARATFLRLKEAAGEHVLTAQGVLQLTDEELHGCGISRQKVSYLKALAGAVEEKFVDFDTFGDMHPDEVRKQLIQVKGIGNWTVDVYLMFSLQSPDILPLGDIGIISAIKDLWAFETMEELTTHTLKWSPYRTTAAFLLWHYYLRKRNRVFPE